MLKGQVPLYQVFDYHAIEVRVGGGGGDASLHSVMMPLVAPGGLGAAKSSQTRAHAHEARHT